MSEKKEIALILYNFCSSIKNELIEYYQRCYSYIKDLYIDNGIDLNSPILSDSKKEIKDTIGMILYSTKTALNTIGISKKRMMREDKKFKEIHGRKKRTISTYAECFEVDLKGIINKILMEILIEYLIDKDYSKIENLDLFDLLPRGFIIYLDQFKEKYIFSANTKRLLNHQLLELDKYINLTDFSLMEDFKDLEMPMEAYVQPTISQETFMEDDLPEYELDLDFLTEFDLFDEAELKPFPQETTPPFTQPTSTSMPAVQETIPPFTQPTSTSMPAVQETTPPFTQPTSTSMPAVQETTPPFTQPTSTSMPPVQETTPPFTQPPSTSMPPVQETTPPFTQPPSTSMPPVQETRPQVKELPIKAPPIAESPLKRETLKEEEIENCLNFFGNFPPINPNIIKTFKINDKNLINSKSINPNFFNLENLFYYITILKMLNIEIPFNQNEIIEIVKKFVNNKVFSTSNDNPPDPINIFYGLSILSEFNMINNTDIIDLLNIEMFVEKEVQNITPQKLHLGFYNLLSEKLLNKSGVILIDKTYLLDPILDFDVSILKEFNPILDLFDQVAVIKLFDETIDLSFFKEFYIKYVKLKIKPNGSIKDNITDSARALLIIALLNFKEQESTTSKKIIKYIVNATEFFNIENNNEFNWKKNKLGFTVELRMLFWALLACSQFPPI